VNSSLALKSLKMVQEVGIHSYNFTGLESGKAYVVYYFFSNDLPFSYRTNSPI
jgi:hypothetical protein